MNISVWWIRNLIFPQNCTVKTHSSISSVYLFACLWKRKTFCYVLVFTRLYLVQRYTKVYINFKLRIVLRRKPGGSDLLVRSQPELFMTEIRSCLYYKGIRLKHFYKCSFFLCSESFCYTRELISDSWPRSTACCSPSSSSSSSSSSQNLSLFSRPTMPS